MIGSDGTTWDVWFRFVSPLPVRKMLSLRTVEMIVLKVRPLHDASKRRSALSRGLGKVKASIPGRPGPCCP